MMDDLVNELRKVVSGKLYYTNTPNSLRLRAADRIEADAKRIAELEKKLRRGGPLEIAAVNNRLTEYMFHWEGRALDAEARVKELEAALSLTRRADDLREHYHSLPNDRNRTGDKRSRKSHARDAWLRAFRKAARAARAALTGEKG